MIPIAKPFVTEVVRIFNQHQYPDVQAGPLTFGKCDFQSANAAEQNGRQIAHLRFNRNLCKLLPELRSQVAEFADIGSWLDLHGIFTLATSITTDEKAVHLSAQKKLHEFKQSIPFLRSPKQHLLNYIFTTAFEKASDAEKEHLIDLAVNLQPTVEASYSRLKKASIQISNLAASILSSPVVIYLPIAFAVSVILSAASVTLFVSQHLAVAVLLDISSSLQRVTPFIPFIKRVAAFGMKATPIYVRYLDRFVEWLSFRNLLKIAICNLIFELTISQINLSYQTKTRIQFIFSLLFPYSAMPLLETALWPFGFLISSHAEIKGNFLANQIERAKIKRFAKEGQNALRIWLELSKMKPSFPAPAPQQIAAQ